MLYNYITLFLPIELPVSGARIARARVCLNYPTNRLPLPLPFNERQTTLGWFIRQVAPE